PAPSDVVSGVGRSQWARGLGAFGMTETPAERSELVRVLTSVREETKGKPRRRKPRAVDASLPVHRPVPELAGSKVLIVDDDIRNIVSLTSVLESHDVEVLHAERGKDGILILEQTPGVDVALIDIM